VIHACVELQPGSALPIATGANLRVIDAGAGQSCNTIETPASGPPEEALAFNQTGPTGAPGATGATGTAGAPGNTVTIQGEVFTLSNGHTFTFSGSPEIAPPPGGGPIIATLTVDGAGVDGTSESFEVSGWSLGVTHAGIGGHNGGEGSGKSSLGEFTISRKQDASSVKLFKLCVSGRHFKTVTLSVRKARSGQEYLRIYFNNVYTTGYQMSSGGDRPTESVTFSYTAMKIKYG
jgi:type VI secretion system secreted protein Hcp